MCVCFVFVVVFPVIVTNLTDYSLLQIQATEDDLVQLPDGSFTCEFYFAVRHRFHESFSVSDEFNQRLRDAGSRQVIVTAPHGAQMGYQVRNRLKHCLKSDDK